MKWQKKIMEIISKIFSFLEVKVSDRFNMLSLAPEITKLL